MSKSSVWQSLIHALWLFITSDNGQRATLFLSCQLGLFECVIYINIIKCNIYLCCPLISKKVKTFGANQKRVNNLLGNTFDLAVKVEVKVIGHTLSWHFVSTVFFTFLFHLDIINPQTRLLCQKLIELNFLNSLRRSLNCLYDTLCKIAF